MVWGFGGLGFRGSGVQGFGRCLRAFLKGLFIRDQ